MITAAGVGSGLDVESIISELMTLERRPLELLQAKQSTYEAQLSAYGKLKSALATFQDAMDELGSLSAFQVYTAASSDESVFTATAASSAQPGSFSLEVVRLAERHKLASTEFNATDTFGGAAGDALTIQVGSDPAVTLTVDLSSAKTLAQVRDAINNAADNPGVTATIINGNNGNQKLVLTAEESGQASALTLSYGGSVSAATFGFQTVNDIGGDLSLLDAELVVDGYTVNRSSNDITDVIDGVTLNLTKADPGVPHTLTIGRDTEAVSASVQAFADAYNELRSTIDSLRSGTLEADGTLRSIEVRLRNVLSTAPVGLTGSYSDRTEIGLTFQKDGTLALDQSLLDTALATDFSGVAALFGDPAEGYAARLESLVDGWTQTDGLLQHRSDGIQDSIDSLEDRQAQMEYRLQLVEGRYRAQFTALDTLIGQLTATSNYLTQQLAALPGASSND